eukprot:6618565-Prymnesium_polylepis.2
MTGVLLRTLHKFGGAATASNGLIVFAPHNADVVGIFDPESRSFSSVDITATIQSDYKYSGAVVQNGLVWFAPNNARAVGVFDPVSRAFWTHDISQWMLTNEYYAGAAATLDGRVVLVPHRSSKAGVLKVVPHPPSPPTPPEPPPAPPLSPLPPLPPPESPPPLP